MRIDMISLFPGMFIGPMGESILGRARNQGLLDIAVTNPRDFAESKHNIVDDTPCGGGAGMVMKVEPVFRAVEHVLATTTFSKRRIILLCPTGEVFNQAKAAELATYDQLILLCGHYEGMDERVRLHLVQESLSIGDFVLTGGELPAMVIADAVARMLPGVLGDHQSARDDSFCRGLLEYPQYTRPRDYRGWQVPEVLLSGDHARIARWRYKESLRNTLLRRPDLLTALDLDKEGQMLLAEIQQEEGQD